MHVAITTSESFHWKTASSCHDSSVIKKRGLEQSLSSALLASSPTPLSDATQVRFFVFGSMDQLLLQFQ